MKKIHLISKTHLDLGFTDYAKNIISRYRDEFIPNAVNLAATLNKNSDTKKFIWTTGSWLICDSLQYAKEENRQKLDDAIKKGYITWHGLPFTTHTELLDIDTLRYGLSLSKELDAKYGKTTVAAKMTDVPGHTKAIIPLLQEYGIKLLHIGVNEASCLPEVPQAFLWKNGDAEVMVVYEGSYGSMYKNEYIDDILYFIHSSDNHGPSNENQINEIYAKLEKEYPSYEICASTLDAYAEVLYKAKDKLPIITSEIGDTWIHGIATDPYKTGAFKELINLKKEWLSDNKLTKDSDIYKQFCDNLLQIAEHTWGMDVKRYFSDYKYLKKDFNKAREKDKVETRLSFKNFYHSWVTLKYRKKGVYTQGSYKAMEKSWQEQREYIDNAINCLPSDMQKEAKAHLEKLRPANAFDKTGYTAANINTPYNIKGFEIIFDDKGLQKLSYKDNVLMENTSGLGTLNYYSYGSSDYEFWKNNYTRNYKTTREWSAPDFLRPGLKNVDKHFLHGVFPYAVEKLFINKDSIIAVYKIESTLSKENGAPEMCEIKYLFEKDKITAELIWLNKEANRLTEAMFINFPVKIEKDSLRFTKIGQQIDPYDIVRCGNRNLSAVENITAESGNLNLIIENIHSPLVSIGGGKILRFDNLFEDVNKKGVSFNLHNNVWGTNFPLWYEDNAYFKFIIRIEK